MRELKATDKITQKMTRDGAVSENLATGEVEHISSREPETELSASSEESAGAAADLALRAAEHHEKKSARKAEKADTQAVRDGSAARQRPSSRLQFTEEERADPALGKYIDRSDRAADRLDAATAAIPTKKVLRTERVFDETAGKGKTQLHFEEVEKRPNGRLRHNPLAVFCLNGQYQEFRLDHAVVAVFQLPAEHIRVKGAYRVKLVLLRCDLNSFAEICFVHPAAHKG